MDILLHLKHFGGFDAGLLANREMLTLKMAAMKHVRRYAIVGGPAWMEGIVKLMNPLVAMDIRTFAEGQEADALTWLKS